MTDRPILFSAPLIRALLEGRKTQTRRLLKKYEPTPGPGYVPHGVFVPHGSRDVFMPVRWEVGDRLWVRESLKRGEGNSVSYMADGSIHPDAEWVWRNKSLPSIHCPRGLSRLKLIVKDVRVERLQEISEADAAAEGTTLTEVIGGHQVWHASHRASFAALWMSINGPDSWKANPFVAVISFEVHRANIDSLHQEAERKQHEAR